MAPFVFPDVLVLAGGGTVGHAWMTGVLAGVEDAAGVDFRRVEFFVGTSAGSIVAARLASGRSPRRAAAPGDDAAERDGEVPAGRMERITRRAAGCGLQRILEVLRGRLDLHATGPGDPSSSPVSWIPRALEVRRHR